MRVLENVELAKYTTVRVGGKAKTMYIPESVDDLLLLSQNCRKYLIGGGSNLLITDSDIEEVVNLREIDNEILVLGNGKFYAGASVRLQKLINCINENGYGGIEYLYSVPGLVGGAIFMNAGSGGIDEAIGCYVDKVKVWNGCEVECLTQEQCDFEHRDSIFKKSGKYIILGVYFTFVQQSIEKSKLLIDNRLKMCNKLQDGSKPNFGSVFKYSDPRIMNIVKRLHLGKKKGCHYSAKTANWIVNEGKGSYKEIVRLINIVKIIHHIFGKNCEEEVIIWN